MKQYKTFADLKMNDVAYLLTMEYNRWVIKEMNVFEFDARYLDARVDDSRILINMDEKVYIELSMSNEYVFADFSFIEDVASIMYMDADYAVKDFKYSHNM